MSDRTDDQQEGVRGWYGPPKSRRFHYFESDGRSLCGKWLVLAWGQYLVDLALGPASGDCAACKKKLGGAS